MPKGAPDDQPQRVSVALGKPVCHSLLLPTPALVPGVPWLVARSRSVWGVVAVLRDPTVCPRRRTRNGHGCDVAGGHVQLQFALPHIGPHTGLHRGPHNYTYGPTRAWAADLTFISRTL